MSKGRRLAPAEVQAASHELRNQICPIADHKTRSAVSSHLRNYAVAEVLILIGWLDGHPSIRGRPPVKKAGATAQQARGSTRNPFAHALPSSLLVAGRAADAYFRTADARRYIDRIFGMGVMAPANWEDAGDFGGVDPREANVVDNVLERFRTDGGLVGAFLRAARCAADSGKWAGDGKPVRRGEALVRFAQKIHREVWHPLAEDAFLDARAHLEAHTKGARDERRRDVLTTRLALVIQQQETFERNLISWNDAGRLFERAVAAENWQSRGG